MEVSEIFCVFGADGFLGAEFLNVVINSTNEKIISFNHECGIFRDSDRIRNYKFELSDENSFSMAAEILKSCSNIKILHLACVHNPDAIKNNPTRAEYINTVCYGKFLDKLSGLDIKKFIYASSDTVYGENRYGRPFREYDELKPVNIYGSQKVAAEKITLDHGYCVVRLPYMSGESATPRKKHFFDILTDDLTSGKPIEMLTDYVRSCLSYSQSAELIYKIFETNTEEKIINVCADSPTDKYTIGLMAADYCGASHDLVHAVTSKELGIFDEYRANILTMDNSLMRSIIKITDPIELYYKKKAL